MKSFVLFVYEMMLEGQLAKSAEVNRDAEARLQIPLCGLRDGDSFAFQILPQTVVQFGETAQLEVGHRLLVLLDLRWIADVARGVSGRHVGRELRSRLLISAARQFHISYHAARARRRGPYQRCLEAGNWEIRTPRLKSGETF